MATTSSFTEGSAVFGGRPICLQPLRIFLPFTNLMLLPFTRPVFQKRLAMM